MKIFAWSCLMLSPLALACNQALSRALRKLDENTVTAYSNFVQIVVFVTLVFALGQDAGVFMDFTLAEWGFLCGTAVSHVLAQVFGFQASQNLPLPVRLPLATAGILYQIVIDMSLFDMSFTTIQFVFVGALVGIKVFELSVFYCIEIPRMEAEKQREKEGRLLIE